MRWIWLSLRKQGKCWTCTVSICVAENLTQQKGEDLSVFSCGIVWEYNGKSSIRNELQVERLVAAGFNVDWYYQVRKGRGIIFSFTLGLELYEIWWISCFIYNGLVSLLMKGHACDFCINVCSAFWIIYFLNCSYP